MSTARYSQVRAVDPGSSAEKSDADIADGRIEPIDPTRSHPALAGYSRTICSRMNNAHVVVALCVMWFSTASMAIITSKTVLMHTWAPFALSFTQFVTASICGIGAGAVSASGGLKALHVPPEQRWSVFKVAACFVAGFLFTNLAFGLLAAPTVEMIKTTQTVSSVLLTVVGASLTNDPFPTSFELLCMAPIVVGVFLATHSELDLTWGGILSTLAANFSFSLRGLVLKEHKFRFRKVGRRLVLRCLVVYGLRSRQGSSSQLRCCVQDAVGALPVFFWSCVFGTVAGLHCEGHCTFCGMRPHH